MIGLTFSVLLSRLGPSEVLTDLKERSRDGTIATSPGFVVLLEVTVEMFFECLISDEPHPTYGTLKLDLFIDFCNSIVIGPIVSISVMLYKLTLRGF